MSSFATATSTAPESPPLVTYETEAARLGHPYDDYYRNRESYESPDVEEYVPILGDEDFVEEMSMPQPPDISLIVGTPASPISLPSLLNATIPPRFGAPLSSTSVATPHLLVRGPLSSTSVAAPTLRVGVPSLLPGISALSFAATTIPSAVPPLRNLVTGEVLPNFSTNSALGFSASAQTATVPATQQIYNVMATRSD